MLEAPNEPNADDVYATIVGIEMDYEHFGNIKSAMEWIKSQPELDDLLNRRNFRLRVTSRSYHLRADEGKVFAYYGDLWRVIHSTTYRPDKNVIYLKQMTKARYERSEVPEKSTVTIEREAKAEVMRKITESKREEKKAIQVEARRKRKEIEKVVAAKVRAQLKAEGLDLDQDKPIRKRKKVEVELTRAQLED